MESPSVLEWIREEKRDHVDHDAESTNDRG
jgi:hypothetical protein